MPETGTIIVTVNKQSEIYISNERATEGQQVRPAELFDAIVTWRGRSPGSVVILKGDKDADFGTISDVMDALAKAKTLRFNLMTDLKRRPTSSAATTPSGAGN